MALFNYASKEITIKIVYYGPGLSGKTTNLQYLHSTFAPSMRGKLISLATEADRTLFFDFLPVELGKIGDFSIRFQLYTVPGQVRYNATRKLVLKGADAVVFVADSQLEMREQNMESAANMRENLAANNIDPDEIPIILQFNKRDLSNIASVEEMNRDLNEQGKYDCTEAVAVNGTGVEETFRRIKRLVMKGIAEKHNISITEPESAPADPAHEKPLPAKSVSSVPVTESAGPAPLSTARNEPVFEVSEHSRNPLQASVQGESSRSGGAYGRDAGEAGGVSKEKLESISGSIQELARSLKELKNILQNVNAEIKEIKKDHKEMQARLKDMSITFNNIKTKRRWFTFL